MEDSLPKFDLPSILRRTGNLARLERLNRVRFSQDQSRELLNVFEKTFSLPPVDVAFTGRTDRGYYYWGDHLIAVRKELITAHILCHEMAHHWCHMKMIGYNHRAPHNIDFINRLDKLAAAAEAEVKGWGLL